LPPLYKKETDKRESLVRFIDDVKRTVVFLSKPDDDGKDMYFATAFIIAIDDIQYLVTAKHAVTDRRTKQISDEGKKVYFNLKTGEYSARSFEEIKNSHNVEWITHPDHDVDIAMIPFGMNVATDDIFRIPKNLFAPIEKLYETCPVMFLSFQPDIPTGKRISPVFRSGIISTINDDRTFYIDAAAFPGNSGGPLYVRPSPFYYDESSQLTIGANPLNGFFIGVIGEAVQYSDIAVSQETGKYRVLFQENTGLSKVWSVAFIDEIIASQPFKDQQEKILRSVSKPPPPPPPPPTMNPDQPLEDKDKKVE
jgi:hypothetical protein